VRTLQRGLAARRRGTSSRVPDPLHEVRNVQFSGGLGLFRRGSQRSGLFRPLTRHLEQQLAMFGIVRLFCRINANGAWYSYNSSSGGISVPSSDFRRVTSSALVECAKLTSLDECPLVTSRPAKISLRLPLPLADQVREALRIGGWVRQRAPSGSPPGGVAFFRRSLGPVGASCSQNRRNGARDCW
jgi:hypothetical protein